MDCYTDPLGWKERLMEGEKVSNVHQEVSSLSNLCTNVRDMDKLFSSIVALGKGMTIILIESIAVEIYSDFSLILQGKVYDLNFNVLAGFVGEGTVRFCVAIDSVCSFSLS